MPLPKQREVMMKILLCFPPKVNDKFRLTYLDLCCPSNSQDPSEKSLSIHFVALYICLHTAGWPTES